MLETNQKKQQELKTTILAIKLVIKVYMLVEVVSLGNVLYFIFNIFLIF